MADYQVGYRKPPRHSQFKKGVCPNPQGRGKRKIRKEGEIFRRVMNLPIRYRDREKFKQASRIELIVKSFGASALKGDVGAAVMLLTLRAHFDKFGDLNPLILVFPEGDKNL